MANDKEKRAQEALERFRNSASVVGSIMNGSQQKLAAAAAVARSVAAPISTPITLPANPNLASEFYKRLVDWIQKYDESLDQEHEVGVRLVSFGQALTFHLQDIGYWNPSLISFKGTTQNGEPVELIQHVSQISVLLQTLKRVDPTQPKHPLGFAAWPDEADEAPNPE
jgi:hypothetical protein